MIERNLSKRRKAEFDVDSRTHTQPKRIAKIEREERQKRRKMEFDGDEDEYYSSDDYSYESDDEHEEVEDDAATKLAKALKLKETGNRLFKEADYEKAVDHYRAAIGVSSLSSPLFHSSAAIKKKKKKKKKNSFFADLPCWRLQSWRRIRRRFTATWLQHVWNSVDFKRPRKLVRKIVVVLGVYGV